jgi:hypothetical protein
LAEQLICNQQVASSILAVSSAGSVGKKSGESVGFLSGQKEQTVNLPAYAFEGSNPSPTIEAEGVGFFYAGVAQLVER